MSTWVAGKGTTPAVTTNADHIRAMTDEELARFLDNHGRLWGSDIVSTANDWLDWLRQEATDG